MENLDELVRKSKRDLGDVSRVVMEYVAHATEFIVNFQLEFGFEMLQKCDEILMSASRQFVLVDSDVIFIVPHTYSLYFFQ